MLYPSVIRSRRSCVSASEALRETLWACESPGVKAVLGALVCSGCSLLYNPSNISPAVDASPDAEIILDADPTQLRLEKVSPAVFFEGRGSDGGRPALLVVHGEHIVPGAVISIAVHGGGTVPTASVGTTEVAANGRMAAAPVVLAVDPTLAAGQTIRIDVTVTQPGPSTPITATIASASPSEDVPVLSITGLDELEGVDVALPTGVHEYSRVAITGTLTASDTAQPLIIRAQASIAVASASVSAAGLGSGPNGHNGGAGGSGVLGAPGLAGGGPGGGTASGGGGGFAAKGADGAAVNTGGAMSGFASIPTFALPNRSSGGAGGNGGLLGAQGGAGGGGGGTLELTAGGTVMVGTLESKGGDGTTAASTLGGGGSGGVILVRSGAAIEATAIDVSGGNGDGIGSVGRIRTDGANVPTTTPAAYRGPTLAADTPVITRNPAPMLTLFGERLKTFSYFVSDENSSNIHGPFDVTTSGASQNSFAIDEPLFRGLNTICVLVEQAVLVEEKPEARNCIELVYLYTP